MRNSDWMRETARNSILDEFPSCFKFLFGATFCKVRALFWHFPQFWALFVRILAAARRRAQNQFYTEANPAYKREYHDRPPLGIYKPAALSQNISNNTHNVTTNNRNPERSKTLQYRVILALLAYTLNNSKLIILFAWTCFGEEVVSPSPQYHETYFGLSWLYSVFRGRFSSPLQSGLFPLSLRSEIAQSRRICKTGCQLAKNHQYRTLKPRIRTLGCRSQNLRELI